MQLTKEFAKHLRAVHFGGNWTSVNLKDTLADVHWQQATKQVDTLNTIVTLVYISITMWRPCSRCWQAQR